MPATQFIKQGSRILWGLLALSCFLIGVQLLGESFTLLGEEYLDQVLAPVGNPAVALLLGILGTMLVQSSSVTTVIIITLAASGALPLTPAIFMIMGANIGSSVTNTIVSLGHFDDPEEFKRALSVATLNDFFNIFVVLILFPLELLFNPLQRLAVAITGGGISNPNAWESPLALVLDPAKQVTVEALGHEPVLVLVTAFVLILGAMKAFVSVIKPLVGTGVAERARSMVFESFPRGVLAGVAITTFVQSSSISSSLIIPFSGVGLVSPRQALPYLIGTNIGTTVTTIMAAFALGSVPALIVAVGHLLFNVAGAVLIYPVRSLPIAAAGVIGSGGFKLSSMVTEPESSPVSA